MMKVQVQIKRAFKSFWILFVFFTKKKTKKTKKSDRPWMKIFFNPQYKCANPLFQNYQLLFLISSLFWEYLNPPVTINKMANKYSVDYHPTPSRLTSKLQPLTQLLTSQSFISLKNICWIFSETCISNHSWGKFSKS